MENKIFDLPLTNQALAEFSATAAKLEAALKIRQEEQRQIQENNRLEIEQKSQALAELQQSTSQVLQNMNGIISQLDNVLENNGTSNDNN